MALSVHESLALFSGHRRLFVCPVASGYALPHIDTYRYVRADLEACSQGVVLPLQPLQHGLALRPAGALQRGDPRRLFWLRLLIRLCARVLGCEGLRKSILLLKASS